MRLIPTISLTDMVLGQKSGSIKLAKKDAKEAKPAAAKKEKAEPKAEKKAAAPKAKKAAATVSWTRAGWT